MRQREAEEAADTDARRRVLQDRQRPCGLEIIHRELDRADVASPSGAAAPAAAYGDTPRNVPDASSKQRSRQPDQKLDRPNDGVK